MGRVMSSRFFFALSVSFSDSIVYSSFLSSFFTNARVNLDGSLEEGVDMTSIFSNRVIDALHSIHVLIFLFNDYA